VDKLRFADPISTLYYQIRKTQSMMYNPFHVNRFQKSISLSFSTNIQNPSSLKCPTKIRFPEQDHAVLLVLLDKIGLFHLGRNQPIRNDLYHSFTRCEAGKEREREKEKERERGRERKRERE